MANDSQLSADQNNNLAVLNQWLGQFGLDNPDLMTSVKNWIIGSYSPDRIKLEIQASPTFKTAFPEYDARIKAGLSPVSPADIINYRQTATKLMKDAGLPSGFYDSPDDFVTLMTAGNGGISPDELSQRIRGGYTKVQQAPQEVKDAFSEYFGVQGDNYLATFFLDPTKGLDTINKALTEAQIGGAGKQYGFNVTQSAAEKYFSQGITDQQARQGFQQANQLKPLAEETISEQTNLTNEQLAEAALTGGDAEAAVKRRQQERAAAFRPAYGGQGGGAQGQRGIGVGGAPST